MNGATELRSMLDVLSAIQSPESSIRKSGEEKINLAREKTPNELVRLLVEVLANGDSAVECRQEAAVLLRPMCESEGCAVWHQLEPPVIQALKAQLLSTLQHDSSRLVRRNSGLVAAAVATSIAEDMEGLQEAWPEFLQTLSRCVASQDTTAKITALGVLKEITGIIGDHFVSQGEQAVATLRACMTDAEAEVRAAAAQLVLQLVEDIELNDSHVLVSLLSLVVDALKSFAASSATEELLKVTLVTLTGAVDEEPDFFKETCFQQLWPFLMSVCQNKHFGDPEVRHCAMEAAMSFARAFVEDFCKAEGQPFLEQLVRINIEWMLEVEDDVDAWTAQVDEDDDDIDGDVVRLGEENIDDLAKDCSAVDESQLEEVFMPLLFKVIRLLLATPGASWTSERAACMAVSQVVEYLGDEAWMDQCVEFITPFLKNAHPRVRYTAFLAVSQMGFDCTPYLQESEHAEPLLQEIVDGLDDGNIRVACQVVDAWTSLGDDLDSETLEPHAEDLMTKLFLRLQQSATTSMQKLCISGIAIVAEVMEEDFEPFYGHVVPALKQIIAQKTGDSERELRGKAFECISFIGVAVGKQTFSQDAQEVMQAMQPSLEAGFAADDTLREYMHEAAGRIADVLGRDFKPYVKSLLVGVFGVLAQRPDHYDDEDIAKLEDDEEDEDERLITLLRRDRGIKTAVLEEMQSSLELVQQLVQALQDEFVEFAPQTCQNLLPLLECELADTCLRDPMFKTWEAMVESTRTAVDSGKCDGAVLVELVIKVIKTTATMMLKAAEVAPKNLALEALQAQAAGISGIVGKAGQGVLTKDVVQQLVELIVKLLACVGEGMTPKDKDVEPETRKRHRKAAAANGDDDGDDDDGEEKKVTRQSVRFSLADAAGALMQSNRADFAEVGLRSFMELVCKLLRDGASDADRSVALYITDDVVDSLGELSIPTWSLFMEKACSSITDSCPVVRQYACNTVGQAARQPIFSQIAPLSAQLVVKVLQKHGERHRRRRAANCEAKQVALSVDAAIRALGLILEHQEQHLGQDAVRAWELWLSLLPMRYNQDLGQKAHAQLLQLLVREHPVVASPGTLPKVLGIFADVYRGKFSSKELDKEIAATFARAGSNGVQQFTGQLPEKQRKKMEQMMKDGQDL